MRFWIPQTWRKISEASVFTIALLIASYLTLTVSGKRRRLLNLTFRIPWSCCVASSSVVVKLFAYLWVVHFLPFEFSAYYFGVNIVAYFWIPFIIFEFLSYFHPRQIQRCHWNGIDLFSSVSLTWVEVRVMAMRSTRYSSSIQKHALWHYSFLWLGLVKVLSRLPSRLPSNFFVHQNFL